MSPVAAAGPRASIVIATHNGRHHLERCLPAVAATAGHEAEVVVVDDASSDGTAEWVSRHHPSVRLVRHPDNLGFGAANRTGALAARGRLLVLLNDDTEPEPGWLEPLLAPLDDDPGVAAACATLVFLEHPEVVNAFGGAMARLGHGVDRLSGHPRVVLADRPRRDDCLFPSGAAMAMRREQFLAGGGFDPAFFMYHEDVDLGWRLWLGGSRVVACREAVVRHRSLGSAGTASGLARRARLGLRHAVRSHLKLAPWPEVVRALAGLAGFLAAQRAPGLALAAAGWNLVRLPSTLSARRRASRSRRRSHSELLSRGLILSARLPAATPELPRVDGPLDPERWLVSTRLLPSRPSAEGRLGWGWYPPERLGSDRVRVTCGAARAVLRVGSGARGRLEVELAPGPGAGGGEATVRCGGGEASAVLRPGSWTTVELPAAGDGSGLLDVRIDSFRRDDGSGRLIGAAVRRLELLPATEPARPPAPSLSVVIPTRNRWPVLASTLDALARQAWNELEVVVVDDGSTDGTYEELGRWRAERRPPFALVALRQEHAGQGAARNRGAAAASGELVLLLGDDVRPEPGCLAAHLAAHREHPGPCAVVGPAWWDRESMRVTPFLDFVQRDGAQFAWDRLADGDEVGFAHFYTSNVSLPRAVALRHPFDEAFTAYGWEDIELGQRLQAAGVAIVYRRRAAARHHHPGSLRGFLARQRRVGESFEELLARRPDLAADPRLPRTPPPRRFRLEDPFWRLATPLLAAADRLGVPLPRAVYRELVQWAFCAGRGRERP